MISVKVLCLLLGLVVIVPAQDSNNDESTVIEPESKQPVRPASFEFGKLQPMLEKVTNDIKDQVKSLTSLLASVLTQGVNICQIENAIKNENKDCEKSKGSSKGGKGKLQATGENVQDDEPSLDEQIKSIFKNLKKKVTNNDFSQKLGDSQKPTTEKKIPSKGSQDPSLNKNNQVPKAEGQSISSFVNNNLNVTTNALPQNRMLGGKTGSRQDASLNKEKSKDSKPSTNIQILTTKDKIPTSSRDTGKPSASENKNESNDSKPTKGNKDASKNKEKSKDSNPK